jgi:VWFA-related protein
VRRRFLLGLFGSLLSFSLLAQPVRDSVTIEVVDVPVFVTRGDQPLTGLTAEDFELYVNGKRQPIEYFDVVGGEGVKPDDAPSLRERRLFVLMFDLAFTQPPSIGRAQRAAAAVIAQASPNDLFAIATFSSRKGVWFTTPFTSDRIALARGISSLSMSESGDPLAIVLTPTERLALANWSLAAPDLTDSFFSNNGVLNRIAGEAMRDMLASQLRRAIEHQILDLKELSARLATLQGQKHVVLLSEGFASNASFGPADFRRTSFAINQQTGYYANPGSGSARNDLFGAYRHLRDMSEAFQAHDILLHTLDLKGVHSFVGNDALYVLAKETGGQFLHNRNDLGNALTDLTTSVSNGYVLGFRPTNAKKKHNTIEVRVKNLPRDAQVRYRRGFSGSPKPFDVNEGLYLADVVLNDVPQTGTAAKLEIVESGLQVHVPLAPLAAQLGASGKAELLIYVFGAGNVPLAFRKVVVDVPANATGEKAYSTDLPEDATVVKALLRVDESLGFSRTDL